MRRIIGQLTVLSLFLPLASAYAQDSFYKGQTVRIIVGASAGGGYDTYSRTIARHIGKHIPGNPTFLVENMPGAGFLISANYMYKVANPMGSPSAISSVDFSYSSSLASPASNSTLPNLNTSVSRPRTIMSSASRKKIPTSRPWTSG